MNALRNAAIEYALRHFLGNTMFKNYFDRDSFNKTYIGGQNRALLINCQLISHCDRFK
jgi:hypothetical protein